MSLEVITKLKTSPKIKSITVTDDGKLLIKWSKVEGAEKYGIKRASSDENEFEHIAWCKKTEFIDENVLTDTTYRYKIMAHKKLEGKKTSTKLSAVKAVVISDIPAPTGLKAGQDKSCGIRLSWDKCDGADEYIVSRRNDFYSQILPVARTKENFFTDDKTVWGQPYHYSVQAIVKSGEEKKQGNFSNEVHFVSLDKGRIIQAKSLHGKKVRLTLRIVTGADCYCIERGESENGPFEEILRTKDALEYYVVDKTPKAYKTYYYRVRALKKVADTEFYGKYCDITAVKSKC
ncbi:MAG: hypothetical protein IKJ27_00865 [Clostridia bacterium]|nr:hypothetical protein [Clostridia bacterium]